MRFWDTSAVVPLLVEEPRSRVCRALLRSDPEMLVWVLTPTEALSALTRLHREGALSAAHSRTARARLDRLARHWTEVDALLPVREEAQRLLLAHPLRAADALQLGAALVAFGGRARGRPFVALDDILVAAARSEGFDGVVPG